MFIDRADEALHPPVDIVLLMARLLYKPFGIIAGIVAGKLATTIFDKVWTKVDRSGDGTAPAATLRDTSNARAISAAALQAATFAGTRAAVDRVSLRGFEYFTGAWAGAKPPKDKDQIEAKASA
jgi:hypothetical protein